MSALVSSLGNSEEASVEHERGTDREGPYVTWTRILNGVRYSEVEGSLEIKYL